MNQHVYEHNRQIWHQVPSTVPGIVANVPFHFSLYSAVMGGMQFGAAAQLAAVSLQAVFKD